MDKKFFAPMGAVVAAVALLSGCSTMGGGQGGHYVPWETPPEAVTHGASGMQLSVNLVSLSGPEPAQAAKLAEDEAQPGSSAGAAMPPLPDGLVPNLGNHTWTLLQALEADGASAWQLPSRGVVLQFDEANQGLAVQGLCNRVHGRYSAQDSGALQVQPLVSTMMACPEQELMRLERQVSELLPQATGWQLINAAPATMELVFAQGQRWLLHGDVKHEALYGAPQRVFLEVAADKQPCSHPLIANKQCLQVRTVDYDGSGLKTMEGPWGAFYDEIDGYTHQAGTRNVLRVKRYTRPQPPADASRYVYVLDMVVETETRR